MCLATRPGSGVAGVLSAVVLNFEDGGRKSPGQCGTNALRTRGRLIGPHDSHYPSFSAAGQVVKL